MMRGGSKTFFAASRLLPPRVRDASVALYAFCRVADDLIDNASSPASSLDHLRHRLDQIYLGEPLQYLEDQALERVVSQYLLPRELLDALLEGFEWDAQGRRYECIEDLYSYCTRVAGTVGAMMSWIMGATSEQALARACDLGVAMQLTNIARDVGEDARNARIYLPLKWLRGSGLDIESWLKTPTFNAQIEQAVRALLEQADLLYHRATFGVAYLPSDCRSAIYAARLIYAEIGEELKRIGCNSVDKRSVVSASRKCVLLLLARIQSPWIKTQRSEPVALDATQYLVDACTQHAKARKVAMIGFPNRPLEQRVEWVVELFERRLKEERAQMQPIRPAGHLIG